MNFKNVGAVLTVLAGDQLSKAVIRRELVLGESVPVLPFFHITHVTNTGAAFGILPNSNLFFILVTFAILGVLFFLRRSWGETRHPALTRWGLLLIVGGALGNLCDRLAFGAVTDFLDFLVWPVFNLADSCICIGIGLLMWSTQGGSRAPDPL